MRQVRTPAQGLGRLRLPPELLSLVERPAELCPKLPACAFRPKTPWLLLFRACKPAETLAFWNNGEVLTSVFEELVELRLVQHAGKLE